MRGGKGGDLAHFCRGLDGNGGRDTGLSVPQRRSSYLSEIKGGREEEENRGKQYESKITEAQKQSS